MKNYIQRGDTIPLTAPADVLSGALVVVGSIVAVAVHDALSGESVECCRVGAFDLAKVSTDVVTVGARLYENGSGLLTVTASTNKFAGVALTAAANPSSSVVCLLTGAHHL